jgi:hypothetical protein
MGSAGAEQGGAGGGGDGQGYAQTSLHLVVLLMVRRTRGGTADAQATTPIWAFRPRRALLQTR